MKLSFHHVALSVSNLRKSCEFYQKLGFSTAMSWSSPNGDMQIERLKLGTVSLELFCFKEAQASPESSRQLSTDLPRIGCKHFALKCENLNETIQELQQKGFQNIPEITTGKTGVRYVFIKDPDGILLEILEEL